MDINNPEFRICGRFSKEISTRQTCLFGVKGDFVNLIAVINVFSYAFMSSWLSYVKALFNPPLQAFKILALLKVSLAEFESVHFAILYTIIWYIFAYHKYQKLTLKWECLQEIEKSLKKSARKIKSIKNNVKLLIYNVQLSGMSYRL